MNKPKLKFNKPEYPGTRKFKGKTKKHAFNMALDHIKGLLDEIHGQTIMKIRGRK